MTYVCGALTCSDGPPFLMPRSSQALLKRPICGQDISRPEEVEDGSRTMNRIRMSVLSQVTDIAFASSVSSASVQSKTVGLPVSSNS
jgi:hypothetical protein